MRQISARDKLGAGRVVNRGCGRRVIVGGTRRVREAPRHPQGRIGVISDTHGLIRPEALAFLRGCNLIIHGGDIGGSEVLDALSSIAPVTAVRGNNDTDPWADRLHQTELIQVGEVLVYVIHDLAKIHTDCCAQGIRVVVSGHSHRPLIEEREGVLFINPGSAGRRRFKLPITIGELLVEGAHVTARIHDLEVARVAQL